MAPVSRYFSFSASEPKEAQAYTQKCKQSAQGRDWWPCSPTSSSMASIYLAYKGVKAAKTAYKKRQERRASELNGITDRLSSPSVDKEDDGVNIALGPPLVDSSSIYLEKPLVLVHMVAGQGVLVPFYRNRLPQILLENGVNEKTYNGILEAFLYLISQTPIDSSGQLSSADENSNNRHRVAVSINGYTMSMTPDEFLQHTNQVFWIPLGLYSHLMDSASLKIAMLDDTRSLRSLVSQSDSTRGVSRGSALYLVLESIPTPDSSVDLTEPMQTLDVLDHKPV